MAPNKRYTEADKIKVIRLHQLGLSDKLIVEQTGFGIGYVSGVTRNYWSEKMKKYGRK